MTAETLILAGFRRAQKAEELIKANGSGDTGDKEQLVEAGLAMSEGAAPVWREVQEALWQQAGNMDIQEVGEALRDMFARSGDVIDKAIRCLTEKFPDHEPAGDVERLRVGVGGGERLGRALQTGWPWVDAERFHKQPAGDRLPGRGRPAKEVFDELRRRVR